jgi:tetratricopeptide (TPR) repeat protein
MSRFESGRAIRAAAAVLLLTTSTAVGSAAATGAADEKLERAVALHEIGDYDGAIAAYREILVLDPGDADAQYELTYSTFLKGDYAGTVALAEKAISQRPDGRAGLYVFLGTARGMLGDWAAGEAVYRRGLAIWPDESMLHFHLGVSLGAQGKFDEASAEFEESLRHMPYQASNWRALADSLERSGRKGRAFAAYARSLTLDKGSQGAVRAARRLREMVFEGARSAGGSLRIDVRVPEGASRNVGATESMGLGLVAALRYGDEWKDQSDSRFFVWAVDRVLELMSAMQSEPAGPEKDFWGPYAFTYFNEGRAAGHMEAMAYDLLASTGDVEALHWRRDHGEANRKYRDWSDRWAVDWTIAR